MSETKIQLLQPKDLSTDFTIRNNQIWLAPTEVLQYETTTPATSIATFNSGTVAQRRMQMVDSASGFGYLHLDFIAQRTGNQSGWEINANAPTPKNLIEVQTYTGGMVWIDAGNRRIKWSGLEVGRRYIVDLVGFWNVNS